MLAQLVCRANQVHNLFRWHWFTACDWYRSLIWIQHWSRLNWWRDSSWSDRALSMAILCHARLHRPLFRCHKSDYQDWSWIQVQLRMGPRFSILDYWLLRDLFRCGIVGQWEKSKSDWHHTDILCRSKPNMWRVHALVQLHFINSHLYLLNWVLACVWIRVYHLYWGRRLKVWDIQCSVYSRHRHFDINWICLYSWNFMD